MDLELNPWLSLCHKHSLTFEETMVVLEFHS